MKKVYLVESIDKKAYEILKEKTILLESEDQLSEAEVVICRNLIIDREFLDTAKHLKRIVIHGTGYDSVDDQLCKERKIEIVTTPGMNAQSVAELMLTLTLEVLRKTGHVHEYIKEHPGNAPALLQGNELFHKNVGFIGSGNTVQCALPLFKAFKTDIRIWSPHVYDKNIKEACSFDEVITKSDIIILSITSTKDTYHLISREVIDKMKHNCIIINTARGAIMDEQALIDAVLDGKIAGCGLDVIEHEPVTEDFPLFKQKNVVLTPHLGGNTKEALENIGRRVVELTLGDMVE